MNRENYNNRFNRLKPDLQKLIYQDKDYQKVLDILNHELSIAPDSRRVYVWLGDTYRAMGDYKSAEGFYFKSLMLTSDKYNTDEHVNKIIAYLYKQMGFQYARENDYRQAAYYLDEAIKRGEKTAAIYLSLGNAYGFSGNPTKGLEFFDKGLNIYLEALACSLDINNKDAVEAIPEVADFLKKSHIYSNCLYRKSHLLGDLGRYREACDVLLRALELCPKDYDSTEFHRVLDLHYSALGSDFMQKSHLKEAIDALEEGISKCRQPMYCFIMLAGVYGKLNALDKQLEYYNKACDLLSACVVTGSKRCEGDPAALYSLVCLYKAKGLKSLKQYADAKATLEEAVECAPESLNTEEIEIELQDLSWVK
jgi:tetratricopeptide (TPR) repeat protein